MSRQRSHNRPDRRAARSATIAASICFGLTPGASLLAQEVDPDVGLGSAPAFTERFTAPALPLERFTRPARTLRVLDGAVSLAVAADPVVPGTHDGGALAHRTNAAFASTELLVQLPDDAVEAAPNTAAAVRLDAALYRTDDGDTVRVALLAGDRGAGREVWAELLRVGPAGTTVLGGATIATPAATAELGDLIAVSLVHDGGTGVEITAGRDIASLFGPTRTGDATVDIVYGAVVTGTDDAAGSARTAATLFDPYANGEYLDLEEVLLERVRDDEAPFLSVGVVDGRVVLDTVGADREPRVASVVVRHPDDAPAVSAAGATLSMDAAAVPLSVDDGAARVTLRVPLYNDAHDGNWNLLEGDVVARVGLERTALGLRAVARIDRFDDADGLATTSLLEHAFDAVVQHGVEYDVSVARDNVATRLFFEGESVGYLDDGDAFVPWDAAVALESTLDAAIGEVTGRFDVLHVGSRDGTDGPGGDEVPPTPRDAFARAYSTHMVELFWTSSTSVPGTVHEIRRDGVLVGTTDGRSFAEGGLEPATEYEYRITAVSADGVRSDGDATVRIATR